MKHSLISMNRKVSSKITILLLPTLTLFMLIILIVVSWYFGVDEKLESVYLEKRIGRYPEVESVHNIKRIDDDRPLYSFSVKLVNGKSIGFTWVRVNLIRGIDDACITNIDDLFFASIYKNTQDGALGGVYPLVCVRGEYFTVVPFDMSSFSSVLKNIDKLEELAGGWPVIVDWGLSKEKMLTGKEDYSTQIGKWKVYYGLSKNY